MYKGCVSRTTNLKIHKEKKAILLRMRLKNFSVQGYAASKVRASCQNRVVRWCVSTNLEARKCGWMQAAALALDIEPRISCIQQKTRQDALRAVKDDRCDIFVAKPDEELRARRYEPLFFILFFLHHAAYLA